MKVLQYTTELANNMDSLRVKSLSSADLQQAISSINNDVIENQDDALIRLTKKFDGIILDNLNIDLDDINIDELNIDIELKEAIDIASKNIKLFHKSQFINQKETVETTEGIECWKEFRAIETVGLYIPGGTAPLFSTLLMLAIPAKLAGCKNIVVCSPPNSGGSVDATILYICKKLGIKNLFAVGGAQAIYAMTYGTETVPKVDKIFGPGNSFVTAAKKDISDVVAIDMPAGPSEVLVWIDENCSAEFAAYDILSQLEHGTDSQAILVSGSEQKVNEVNKKINEIIPTLSRKDIIKKSIDNYYAIITDSDEDSVNLINSYAPEHLIMSSDEHSKYLSEIVNAGSVFIGKYTSESLGDYASGTNHTLPTSGFAKSYSGVSVDSFGKWITFQKASKSGINNISKTVEVLADAEGLEAHKLASKVRRISDE